MNKKILYWLSGIIGGAFLLLIFILKAYSKIKWGGLIFFGIIIVVGIVIIDILTWMSKSQKTSQLLKEEKKKSLNLEEARKISIEEMGSLQYSEYEKEVIWEDIVQMGNQNTPVYVKMARGVFDGKIFGIVINMLDHTRRGIEVYDDTKIDEEEIKRQIKTRANLVSFNPSQIIPMKRIKSLDPHTGRLIEQEEPLPSIMPEEEEKGGMS